MARPPRLTLAGLLLGFLLLAGSSKANQCNVGCHGVRATKAYQEGHTYIYQLEGVSSTSVSDAEGDAKIRLGATVELSVTSDCVHQVRLKNVLINGAPAPDREIEQHALQFNYYNGHVESGVCAENGDSQSALNVKRAVISLFQHATPRDSGAAIRHETDIFGACPTDFSFESNGDVVTVTKHRNLAQCSHRENIRQDLISANFNEHSYVKSIPLLGSDLKVVQKFERGILHEANSVETYRYKPFSNGEAGAKTVVETSLTYKGVRAGISAAPVSVPKTLIFEAPHQVVRSSVHAIEEALRAAKESMPDAVTPSAAHRFSELVSVLRQSSKDDILAVYSRVRAGAGYDKVSAKRVLFDALFRTGTGEAVEVLVELVKNREVADIDALVFYTSLAFVHHANLASVTAVVTLLDQPNFPRIGYLGVGSLIGKYCREHQCDNVPAVTRALAKITTKIGNTRGHKEQDVAISALKALANSNYLDEATLVKIAGIATDTHVNNRVRVVALETLPTKCSMAWKKIVFGTMADREEDSEVRIKAYLALVACPCPNVANKLKEVLDKETVNQFGSFVTSHLRNLRASTNPDKAEAKRQLGLIRPRTRFPEDFRKFSFNNELSYALDGFGSGASTESNVIYSQKSFVPRSASINLTTQIFGHAFNFLELEGRAENLDRLLEKDFGPKGTFSDQAKQFVLKQLSRKGRSVNPREVEQFRKSIKLSDDDLSRDLELDLSVKMFGAELAFLNYHGSDDDLTIESIFDRISNVFKSGIQKAENFDHHFKNHLQFLDAELVYPTGLGFPLSLGVAGTSAVHLKTRGKLDIATILKNPQTAKIDIAVEPSASIRIAGSLVVGSYGVEAGLKLISTLHTATATDLVVKLLDGKGIDVNLGLPKQKQEIFSFTSEILVSSGAKGHDYVAPRFPKGKEYKDCFDQFVDVIGLRVCGEMSFPYENVASVTRKALFPLSGPAKFVFYFENKDARNYHFTARYDKETHSQSFQIVFDTPNSRTNRRVSFVAEATVAPEKSFNIAFDSPIKKASIAGLVRTNEREMTVSITLKHDSDEYFGKVGVASSGNRYTPILEYKIPEHVERLATKNTKSPQTRGQQYRTSGAIDVSNANGGKTFTFRRLALTGNGHTIVSIDGTFTLQHPSANVDLRTEYGNDVLSVKGNAHLTDLRNYKASVTATSSKNPNAGFSISLENKGDEHSGEQELVIVHGRDLQSQVNRFELSGKHRLLLKSVQEFDVYVKRKLKYPLLGVDVEVEGGVTPKSIAYDVEFQYQNFKAGSELSAKTGTTKPGDFDIEFEAQLQDNGVEFKTKRLIVDARRSKWTGSLELRPGNKIEVSADTVYDVRPNNIDAQLNGNVKFNAKSTNVDAALTVTPETIDSHADVKVNNIKYLEFLIEVRRAKAAPSGHLKLNIKDRLSADGRYSYQQGKGDAHFNLELPAFKRQIVGEADLTVVGTRHVATIQISYDAARDASKRLRFGTNTDITETSISTKNTFEVLSYKTVFDANAKIQGKIDNGQQQGDFELTLPNGRYIVVKAQRDVTTNDKGVMSGKLHLDVADHERKGGKSQTFAWDATGRHINRKTGELDTTQNLRFVSFAGKDAKVVFDMKNMGVGGENKARAGKINLSGSLLPAPISFEVSSEHQNEDHQGSGTLKGSVGNNWRLQANGNYEKGNNVDKPCTVKGEIDMKLANDKFRNFKFEGYTSILIPKEVGGRFELSGQKKLTYNDDKNLKTDYHYTQIGFPDREHSVEGSGKVTFEILKNPPMTLGYTFKHDPTKELKESAGAFNVNYGAKKGSIAFDSKYFADLSKLDVESKIDSPFEKLHNVELRYHHENNFKEGSKKFSKVDATLIANQARYGIQSDMQVTEDSAIHTMVIDAPSGKTNYMHKYNKLGEREGKSEIKITSPHGNVVADSHVNLDSVDNFFIIVNVDSDPSKYRKIHFEISNKLVKTGRRIVINVSSDGKNIVMGSTNYKKHEDGKKLVIEGNGSLKIGDKSQASSFKFNKQQLTKDVDGETGIAMLLNINFGQSGIVGEYKLTNKEYHFLSSYCEQSKDCAQFEIQSKGSTGDGKYTRESTVEVDLRKFNVPFEFGLKTNDKIELFGFDHTATLYLHSSKDKTEYSYRFYGYPTEYGIVIALPSRELASIVTVTIPKTKPYGTYAFDASIYSDRKNKPAEKTSWNSELAIAAIGKDGANIAGKTKFTYPGQPKELSVRGDLRVAGKQSLQANVDLDIFAKRDQKISFAVEIVNVPLPKGYNFTGTATLTSRGQHLKFNTDQHLTISANNIGFGSFASYTDRNQKPKSTGILFSVNLQEAHILIYSPNKQLIKADSVIKFDRIVQKIDTEVVLLDTEPEVLSFEVKNLESFTFLQYKKNEPQTKLEVSGNAILNKQVQLEAVSYKSGVKNPLFHVRVYLDQKRFLKPDFGSSQKNIAAVINEYRNYAIRIVELAKEYATDLGQEILSELADFFKQVEKALPNLKPLVAHYQSVLDQLKQELLSENESLQELQAKLRTIFGGPVAEIMKILKEAFDQITQLYTEYTKIFKDFSEALRAMVPQIKESYAKINEALGAFVKSVVDLFVESIKITSNIITSHRKEFEELFAVAAQLANDVGKIVHVSLSDVVNEIKTFVAAITDQARKLPIAKIITDKIEELRRWKVPETVIRTVSGLVESVKKFLPTNELKQFVGITFEYVLKLVRQEQVDNVKELSKISGLAVNALESLRKLLFTRVRVENLFDFLDTNIVLDFSGFSQLPGLNTFKSSIVSLFRGGELPTLTDIYQAYRPTLYFKDLLPPFSKFAVFADGGHFFTFDGRHLTLPGKCSYVLAQDSRDGNFSIIAELNNGKLSAVTITEPTDSITILSSGKILVNNQPAEFPASTRNLQAFLTYPKLNVASAYGVKLSCSSEAPLICSVHVSGFYHGRLRGILGDANNEPYDDFTLPSGKITESESVLGNSYKLNSGCPNVQTVDHKTTHHHDATCTKYFTGDSSLSDCFHYVNPASYRQACDHATSDGSKDHACLIAAAYVAECLQARIFIDIPKTCAHCEVGNQKIEIGDSFSSQFPNKQADIVFVVEQASENSKIFTDLIARLITTLRSELKDRGVNDVKVALIGYGDHMEWPQHYTNGGSRNIAGDVKHMKFQDRKPTISLEEAKAGDLKKKVDFLVQEVSNELGIFKLTDAYEEAIRYPFRPGAARTVVGVIATPCDKSRLPISLQQLRLLVGHKMYSDRGLTYHHISALDDILVHGKPAKNIVGFDSDRVFTFADSKKRVVEGSSSLRNDMTLANNDVCANFAANSGGAAFSTHNFLEAKSANHQRQFIQVAARRMVESLTSVEYKQDCVCRLHHGFTARSDCKIISRKEKEHTAPLTKVKG